MTTANDYQPGGDHYKKHGETGEQHWDRMWRLFGPAWFIGNATKYLERCGDKNGLQDIEKAIHYSIKLKELVEAWQAGTGPPPGRPDFKRLAPKPSIVINTGVRRTFAECTCPCEQQSIVQTPTGSAYECNLCGKKVAIS